MRRMRVPQELIQRGFRVIAFSREKAGIKGKMGKEDVAKVGRPSMVFI